MQVLLSKFWLLVAATWYTVNGVLHDIFVILNHKGGYDRELLRLLMDGHVLILSGLIMLVCYFMAETATQFGAIIAIITAIGMISYCMMIFPFLKSFGTIGISLLALVVGIKMLLAHH